jgi:hypothetical protein
VFVEAATELLEQLRPMSREDAVAALAGFLLGTYDSGIRNASQRCSDKGKPILAAELWAMQQGPQKTS